MHDLKAIVYARLDAIAAAEKITRSELKDLSRELLTYVPDTHDIDIVNRLIGVLTPINRKVAILFFEHFLPWQVEKTPQGDFSRFGKMLEKEKQVKRRLEQITEFLKDLNNNIWSWASDNVETELKPKNFKQDIIKAIQKSLKGDEKTQTPALNHTQVMLAVLESGITIEDLLAAVAVQAEVDRLLGGEVTPQVPAEQPEVVAEQPEVAEAA